MTTGTWIKSSYCDTSAYVEVGFRKSSYCGGGECVEVAYATSSASSGNGACVEVGRCACSEVGEVLVRDSKDKDGPVLRFTGDEWSAFISSIKDEEIG